MIISASRRTDIPSYYSDWFLKRLKEGFVYVRNPMNSNQISRVSLSQEDVECFVFWTKNPYPLMKNLDALESFNYYFQFTLTSYTKSIEKNLPSKSELVPVFRKLADKIGKDRVVWRYDPVLLSDTITIESHLENFELLAKKLQFSTNKCVFSFIDSYAKIKNRLSRSNIVIPDTDQVMQLAKGFSDICGSYNLEISTCSETYDFSRFGIKKNKCIDDDLIKSVFELYGDVIKDTNQRPECGCAKSIDIGAYNTCNHNCIYCYANVSDSNLVNVNQNSPILGGDITDSMKIYDRKMEQLFSSQIKLNGF